MLKGPPCVCASSREAARARADGAAPRVLPISNRPLTRPRPRSRLPGRAPWPAADAPCGTGGGCPAEDASLGAGRERQGGAVSALASPLGRRPSAARRRRQRTGPIRRLPACTARACLQLHAAIGHAVELVPADQARVVKPKLRHAVERHVRAGLGGRHQVAEAGRRARAPPHAHHSRLPLPHALQLDLQRREAPGAVAGGGGGAFASERASTGLALAWPGSGQAGW